MDYTGGFEDVENRIAKDAPASVQSIIFDNDWHRTAIPDWLYDLVELRSLHITHMASLASVELDPRFSRLNKLQKLTLPYQITDGAPLATLEELTELTASGPCLASLSTPRRANLKRFHVLVGPLPSTIGECAALEELSLESSDVTIVPPEVALLPRLRVLSLKGASQVTAIAPEVAAMTSLVEIDVDGARILALGPEFARFTPTPPVPPTGASPSAIKLQKAIHRAQKEAFLDALERGGMPPRPGAKKKRPRDDDE